MQSRILLNWLNFFFKIGCKISHWLTKRWTKLCLKDLTFCLKVIELIDGRVQSWLNAKTEQDVIEWINRENIPIFTGSNWRWTPNCVSSNQSKRTNIRRVGTCNGTKYKSCSLSSWAIVRCWANDHRGDNRRTSKTKSLTAAGRWWPTRCGGNGSFPRGNFHFPPSKSSEFLLPFIAETIPRRIRQESVKDPSRIRQKSAQGPATVSSVALPLPEQVHAMFCWQFQSSLQFPIKWISVVIFTALKESWKIPEGFLNGPSPVRQESSFRAIKAQILLMSHWQFSSGFRAVSAQFGGVFHWQLPGSSFFYLFLDDSTPKESIKRLEYQFVRLTDLWQF